MGLDMYLNKKTYVRQWEHKGDDNYKVQIIYTNGLWITSKRGTTIVESIQ
jgi:hypothetical protein